MSRRRRHSSPFRLKIREELLQSIGSIIFFILTGLLILSFTGRGQIFSPIYELLRTWFGMATLILPFVLFTAGFLLTGIKWALAKPTVFLGTLIFFIGTLGMFAAGSVGYSLYHLLSGYILPAGSSLVFFFVVLIGALLVSDVGLGELLHFIASVFEIVPKDEREKKQELEDGNASKDEEENGEDKRFHLLPNSSLFSKDASSEPEEVEEKTVSKSPLSPEGKIELLHAASVAEAKMKPTTKLPTPASEMKIWQLPPISLLEAKNGGQANRGNVKGNADVIEQTLESFGIQAKVVEFHGGPAVTQYGIAIGTGTKLSKITALANDLALSLAAPTGQIRIEAPIPGKSLVGIEVPNISPEFVTLRKMLSSDLMKGNNSKLAVALGLNVAGQPVVVDIAKMPHALIAGATGSGKSVAINSFIASILFRATPAEVKFIMVDPKRVELTQYNGIPHLLTPVITEPQKVLSALKWATAEMDSRYKLCAEVGVRNITAYNELAGFQAMHYIVIVIDELADIMLFAPAEVEECVTRIAQMARAVGIHLLLATQRPSVNVLTGLIKANIPTRIAFNVSSMIDSRVIIDQPGAEKLLGRGDMLYVPPDQAKPTRVQGTFVSDQEIQRMIAFLKTQAEGEPQYSEEVTEKFQNIQAGTAAGGTSPEGKDEQLMVDALRVILQYNKASVSILQRKLSLGYGRAARIMDMLCEEGVVGEADGSKSREIFVTRGQEFIAQHEVKQ